MKENFLDVELIAPCGMYCGFCCGYLRMQELKTRKKKEHEYKGCTGCRARNKQCSFIKKSCAKIRNGEIKYCYQCEDFPCKNLKYLDEKYKRDYGYSFVDAQSKLKELGEEEYLKIIEKENKCPKCGWLVCIHTGTCFNCGYKMREIKKRLGQFKDKY